MELLKTAFEFVVVTIFIKQIMGRWLADKITRVFQKFFVKSRREAAIWLHYRNKALNKGHTHKTPIRCEDDACKIFPLK